MNKFLLILLLSLMLVFVIGADSDDEGDIGSLGIALFLAGPIFYGVISAVYSGKNKRHDHEVATESQIDGLQFYDNFEKSVKGSTSSSIGSVTYSNQNTWNNKGSKAGYTERAVNATMRNHNID